MLNRPARSGFAPRAFTLVELLMVITIISLLMAMLLPALGKAKTVAIISRCAGNMHQHAILQTQYFADCKDRLPPPASPHQYTGVGNNINWKTRAISMISPNGIACPSTPNTNGTIWPAGIGWYYYMGYLPPLINKAKLAMWDCPGAPNYSTTPHTRAQFFEASWSDFSRTSGSISRKQLNPASSPTGSSTDCQNSGPTGYIYRDWFKSSTTMGMSAGDWKPSNAVGVCNETAWMGQVNNHSDGLNIQYFDGHVGFGGKNINGLMAFVYYGYAVNGYTIPQSTGSTTINEDCNSGWVYGGGTGINRLWTYYESGVK